MDRRGGSGGGGPTPHGWQQRPRQQQPHHHNNDQQQQRRYNHHPSQPQQQQQPPMSQSQHANPYYGQMRRQGGGGMGGGSGYKPGHDHGHHHHPVMTEPPPPAVAPPPTSSSSSSSSSHTGGVGLQRQPQQPLQPLQPSAAEEELRRQIAELKSQVESQNDTIFELNASLSAAEAESSHRATRAESDAASRVREAEDRVRRYREESNVARARLASVLRAQKKSSSSPKGTVAAVSPPFETGGGGTTDGPAKKGGGDGDVSATTVSAITGAGKEDQAPSKVDGDVVVTGASASVARVSTSPENESGRLAREAAVASTPADNTKRDDGEGSRTGGESAGRRKRDASSALESTSDAKTGVIACQRNESGGFGIDVEVGGSGGGIRGLAMHLMLRHDDIVSELLLLERQLLWEDEEGEGVGSAPPSSPPSSSSASKTVARRQHAARRRRAASSGRPRLSSSSSSSSPTQPASPLPSSSSFLDEGLSKDVHFMRAALRTILSSPTKGGKEDVNAEVGAVSIRRLVRTAVDSSLVGFRRLTEALDSPRSQRRRHTPREQTDSRDGGLAADAGSDHHPPTEDDGVAAAAFATGVTPPSSSPARDALRLLHALRFLGLVLSAGGSDGRDVVRSLVASNYDDRAYSPKIRLSPQSGMAGRIAVPSNEVSQGGSRGDGDDSGSPRTKSVSATPCFRVPHGRIRGLPVSRIAAASSALRHVSRVWYHGGEMTGPLSLGGDHNPPPPVIAWDEEEYDRTSRELVHMIQALLLGGERTDGRSRRQKKRMRRTPLRDCSQWMPLLRMEMMSLLNLLTFDCDDVASGMTRVPRRGFWNVMYLLLFTRSRSSSSAAAGCGPDDKEKIGDNGLPPNSDTKKCAPNFGKLGSAMTGNAKSSITTTCWSKIFDAVTILETPSSARGESETSSSSSSSNKLASLLLKFAIVEFFARAMSAAAQSSSSSPGCSRWSTDFVRDHGRRVVSALSRDIREILTLVRSVRVNDGTDESSRHDRKRLRSGRDGGVATAPGFESPSVVLPSSIFFKTSVRFAILAVELMTAYCHHHDDGIYLVLQQKQHMRHGGTRSFEAANAKIGALKGGSSSCIDVIVDLFDFAVSNLLLRCSVGATTWYPNVLGRLIRSILALFSRMVTCANSLHSDEEVDQLTLLAIIRNRKESFCSNCFLVMESDCCGHIDDATRQDAQRLIQEVTLDEQEEELAVTAMRLTS